MNLNSWAIKWGVSLAAVADLRQELGLEGHTTDLVSEAGVQKAVRLEAARMGVVLWRNNNGAYQDDQGNWVRYGLANDSKQMNQNIKSSDLIGIRPGGQFVAREIKKPGWRYTGTQREQAQLKFITLVLTVGS